MKLIKKHSGLGNSKEKLTKQLQELAAELLQDTQDKPEKSENKPLAKSKIALSETEPELMEQAKKFLQNPYLLQKTVDHIHRLELAGEDELVVAVYIIGTSRLLKKPLAGLTMGQSSAGKKFCY